MRIIVADRVSKFILPIAARQSRTIRLPVGAPEGARTGLRRGPGFLGLGGLRGHSATDPNLTELFPTDLHLRQGLGDPMTLRTPPGPVAAQPFERKRLCGKSAIGVIRLPGGSDGDGTARPYSDPD